jgi:hypothetical protein
MAAETANTRNLTRQAKDLSLTQAIEVLKNLKKYPDLYKDTYLTVLKNSVPRVSLPRTDRKRAGHPY